MPPFRDRRLLLETEGSFPKPKTPSRDRGLLLETARSSSIESRPTTAPTTERRDAQEEVRPASRRRFADVRPLDLIPESVRSAIGGGLHRRVSRARVARSVGTAIGCSSRAASAAADDLLVGPIPGARASPEAVAALGRRRWCAGHLCAPVGATDPCAAFGAATEPKNPTHRRTKERTPKMIRGYGRPACPRPQVAA